MNSFQSFVDHMLNITETLQVNELYKAGALVRVKLFVRHLLRSLQHFDTTGEKYSRDAIGEINEKWLPQLNKELAEIPWKLDITRNTILVEWENQLIDALDSYERNYKDDIRLYPITGIHAVNLKRKLVDNSIVFEDLGLIEDLNNKKKLQFTFSFEKALEKNV